MFPTILKFREIESLLFNTVVLFLGLLRVTCLPQETTLILWLT